MSCNASVYEWLAFSLLLLTILAFNPNLHISSQSLRLCSEEAGDVNSIYSTPKASSAFAILILVSVSKNALANCSPSRSVDSMIEKLETAWFPKVSERFCERVAEIQKAKR